MNKQSPKEYQVIVSTKFTVLAEDGKGAKEGAIQHLRYKWEWEEPDDILSIQEKESQ